MPPLPQQVITNYSSCIRVYPQLRRWSRSAKPKAGKCRCVSHQSRHAHSGPPTWLKMGVQQPQLPTCGVERACLHGMQHIFEFCGCNMQAAAIKMPPSRPPMTCLRLSCATGLRAMECLLHCFESVSDHHVEGALRAWSHPKISLLTLITFQDKS